MKQISQLQKHAFDYDKEARHQQTVLEEDPWQYYRRRYPETPRVALRHKLFRANLPIVTTDYKQRLEARGTLKRLSEEESAEIVDETEVVVEDVKEEEDEDALNQDHS